MSEYTNYFAVRSSNKYDVKEKLNEGKVCSVVNADEDQYWFLEDFKSDKPYQWVTFGCLDGGDIKELFGIFDQFIHFFGNEDRMRWHLSLYSRGETISFQFDEDKEYVFSDEVKGILSSFFNKDFIEMEPYLTYGKGGEFLNFIGIPNIDMFDQDLLPSFFFEKEYSIFEDELND